MENKRHSQATGQLQPQQQQQQQQQSSNVRSASKEKRKPPSGLGTPTESKIPPGKVVQDGKKEKSSVPKPISKPPSKVTPILFTNSNSTTGVGYIKEIAFFGKHIMNFP